VASVSCIYGLGERADYQAMGQHFRVGQTIKRNQLLRQLVSIQYVRDDAEFKRGSFRVKGENIDIHLATGEAVARIIMSGDVIDKILIINIKPGRTEPVKYLPLLAKERAGVRSITILPAKHFITPEEKMQRALKAIRRELKSRLKELKKQNKEVEAYRLEKKTNYDLEMMAEAGYCNGIENYSRHLTGRAPGQPPETLIDFGFRLPSARDNRPLNFEEFNEKFKQAVYVSATPSDYEIKNSAQVAEQLIRPTGLLDPEVEVMPSVGQIQDLIKEVAARVAKSQRVLVTTLTKRLAEELASYLAGR